MNQNYSPYEYQHVPTIPQTPVPASRLKNQSQPIQNYNMSDSDFFNSLSKYKPLLYSGRGSPILLVNKDWYLSLGCILIMNALFLLVILLFLRQAGSGIRPMSQ